MGNVIETRPNNRKRVKFMTSGQSRVEQSHRQMTNINTIVAKAKKTGRLPISSRQPTYGDFSNAQDYHAVQTRIVTAQNEFMEVPSEIRKRFHNDVGEFIDFVQNPDNLSEAVAMGLIPESALPPAPPESVPTAEPESVPTDVPE